MIFFPGAKNASTVAVRAETDVTEPRTNPPGVSTMLPSSMPLDFPVPMVKVPYGDESNEERTGAVMPEASIASLAIARNASFSSSRV